MILVKDEAEVKQFSGRYIQISNVSKLVVPYSQNMEKLNKITNHLIFKMCSIIKFHM